MVKRTLGSFLQRDIDGSEGASPPKIGSRPEAMMNEFKIGRALGLSVRAWGRNLIPFTALALVLYAAPVVWILTKVGTATTADDLANHAFI